VALLPDYATVHNGLQHRRGWHSQRSGASEDAQEPLQQLEYGELKKLSLANEI
jgi:hypothetical protein